MPRTSDPIGGYSRDDLATLTDRDLDRFQREGFLTKNDVQLERQRRMRARNDQRDPTRPRQATVAVRHSDGRTSMDTDEYTLMLRMLGATKALLPVLEQKGVPVTHAHLWKILTEGFADLAVYFRTAGARGVETEIAELLELAAALADET